MRGLHYDIEGLSFALGKTEEQVSHEKITVRCQSGTDRKEKSGGGPSNLKKAEKGKG